jgi:membrane-bound metal-dependent hydrolase YbcI (DUF457 family)
VIGGADLLLRRWDGPSLTVVGMLDEPAHACTGTLALSALGETFELPVLLAAVAGSVAIDLDHLPGMLGSDLLVLPRPTPTRPCTHSLVTLALLMTAALPVRGSARRLILVAASGLAMHYFRDVTEPGGAGAPLLWPLSDRVYSLGYRWYVAALLALAALALGRRTASSERL